MADGREYMLTLFNLLGKLLPQPSIDHEQWAGLGPRVRLAAEGVDTHGEGCEAIVEGVGTDESVTTGLEHLKLGARSGMDEKEEKKSSQ